MRRIRGRRTGVIAALVLLPMGCGGTGESQADRALLAEIGARSDAAAEIARSVHALGEGDPLAGLNAATALFSADEAQVLTMSRAEAGALRAGIRDSVRAMRRITRELEHAQVELATLHIDWGPHVGASDGPSGLLDAWNELVSGVVYRFEGARKGYAAMRTALGRITLVLDAAERGDADAFRRVRADVRAEVADAVEATQRELVDFDGPGAQLMSRAAADTDVRDALRAVNEAHPEGVLAPG